ncbi:hypothetical protein [Algoriphagus yeomjeoni]|nr:hypothetical protein [Algoriphagus yeomjeoni]
MNSNSRKSYQNIQSIDWVGVSLLSIYSLFKVQDRLHRRRNHGFGNYLNSECSFYYNREHIKIRELRSDYLGFPVTHFASGNSLKMF